MSQTTDRSEIVVCNLGHIITENRMWKGRQSSHLCTLTITDLLCSFYVHIFSSWCFHLIVVRGFEYARDPESYTSGSIATGRVSLAGQVKG